MIILGLAELFKRMNQSGRPDPAPPGPTVTLFDGLFFRKISKIGTNNLDIIFFQNFESISSIIWKVIAFQHRNNFSNFWLIFWS